MQQEIQIDERPDGHIGGIGGPGSRNERGFDRYGGCIQREDQRHAEEDLVLWLLRPLTNQGKQKYRKAIHDRRKAEGQLTHRNVTPFGSDTRIHFYYTTVL